MSANLNPQKSRWLKRRRIHGKWDIVPFYGHTRAQHLRTRDRRLKNKCARAMRRRQRMRS